MKRCLVTGLGFVRVPEAKLCFNNNYESCSTKHLAQIGIRCFVFRFLEIKNDADISPAWKAEIVRVQHSPLIGCEIGSSTLSNTRCIGEQYLATVGGQETIIVR